MALGFMCEVDLRTRNKSLLSSLSHRSSEHVTMTCTVTLSPYALLISKSMVKHFESNLYKPSMVNQGLVCSQVQQ